MTTSIENLIGKVDTLIYVREELQMPGMLPHPVNNPSRFFAQIFIKVGTSEMQVWESPDATTVRDDAVHLAAEYLAEEYGALDPSVPRVASLHIPGVTGQMTPEQQAALSAQLSQQMEQMQQTMDALHKMQAEQPADG